MGDRCKSIPCAYEAVQDGFCSWECYRLWDAREELARAEAAVEALEEPAARVECVTCGHWRGHHVEDVPGPGSASGCWHDADRNYCECDLFVAVEVAP